MGEDIRTDEEDRGSVVPGLRRGDVRRADKGGAGCVCMPGRGMSKERRVSLAEVCCVSSGVMRLWSG